MSTEILAIPEENLDEVIYVIRAGIRFCQAIPIDPMVRGREISPKVLKLLEDWCIDESEYLVSWEHSHLWLNDGDDK